jgi:alanine racemase
MDEYTTREIAAMFGGELTGSPREVISGISTDSRTLHQPEATLFVAIRGDRHDGHAFIPELLDRGIKAFLVEELPAHPPGNASFILVKDSLKALQALAAAHRRRYGCRVIGITGSNGKTIVKEWINQTLSPDQKIVRSPKSYNSQIGVPLSVLLLDQHAETGVFEAGISRPGEMIKLEAIIRPSIGIFTNIGEAHQQGFLDMEEKLEQKLILFKDSSKIIYCSDQEVVNRIITKRFRAEKLFSWSFGKESDVRVSRRDGAGEEGTKLDITFGDISLDLLVPFQDKASIENAMHVVSLMLLLEMPPLVIQSRMADLNPVAMRLEMVKALHGCTIINDTYNSDLNSLSIALDYLNQQRQHAVKTLILSDILQSGKEEDILYAEVSALLKRKGVSRFIGIGPALMRMRRQFPASAQFYLSTAEFLSDIAAHDFRNEAILIKGSRSFRFEKITSRLQQKNHRTILEIDLNALIHNLNIYRSKTTARIMVVVKAFSYGSGSQEIANALQYQRVDYLCVAYVDEGIVLREAGIHLPILVMNPEVSGFDGMMDHDLEPEIYNFRSLFSFLGALAKRNLVSYPVHLKLETGMNRLGFREDELDQLFEILRQNRHVRIGSVFSHLGTADEAFNDAFTLKQIETFERMSSRIRDQYPYEILRHILNSAGIERFPEASFDMVRLGIGLYGISQHIDEELKPVSTLKSIISQIKPVRKGESVGYSRNFIAPADMTVGVVPVGYADGLRRDLGRHGICFYLNGSAAPVLGTICMDMTMIDLTHLEANEGDEVIIFGPGHPVTELAEKLGTIPYEILAGLSERVKRVYFQE